MLRRWVTRLWHWLIDPQPWNRHAPYRHGDPPPRRDEGNGLRWEDKDD